jgi:hypothetical protein
MAGDGVTTDRENAAKESGTGFDAICDSVIFGCATAIPRVNADRNEIDCVVMASFDTGFDRAAPAVAIGDGVGTARRTAAVAPGCACKADDRVEKIGFLVDLGVAEPPGAAACDPPAAPSCEVGGLLGGGEAFPSSAAATPVANEVSNQAETANPP